jgi:quinol monooxygenase YgiN
VNPVLGDYAAAGRGEVTLAALGILVEFVLKPQAAEKFRALVLVNAAQSLRDEPGCRQFDVTSPIGESNRIVLYEIYDDAAAFDKHLEMPHYKSFAAATEAMVETKVVQRLEFFSPIKA